MEIKNGHFIKLAQTVIEALDSDWFAQIKLIAETFGDIDGIEARPNGVYCRYVDGACSDGIFPEVDGLYADDAAAAEFFFEDIDLVKAALNGKASLEPCPHFYNVENGCACGCVDETTFSKFEGFMKAYIESLSSRNGVMRQSTR